MKQLNLYRILIGPNGGATMDGRYENGVAMRTGGPVFHVASNSIEEALASFMVDNGTRVLSIQDEGEVFVVEDGGKKP